jgi:cholesterol oxidase
MSTASGKYDVVVIGSGFGGSVAASTLTDGGASVLLLERGPWRDTKPVRDAGIEGRKPLPYGRHFYTHALNRVASPFTRATGWRYNRNGFFDLHYSKDMSVLWTSGVGGGSHVYAAMNVRPEVSGYWDGHVDGVNAEKMEQHYSWMIDKMEGKAPAPGYKLPNATFDRYKDSSEFTADGDVEQPVMSVRMDGNQEDYKNNSFLGSKNGAKATLDRVLLLPALEKGLTVRAQHECLAIWKQSSGGYLLEVMDHKRKRRSFIRASKVVLSAGTLNTVKLLFRSREVGGLSGMPALGVGFGGNGDMPAYWAVNDAGADYTTGIPCHGRFALRDPETGKAMPGPDLTSYGFNGFGDIPIPDSIRSRLKRDLLVVSMGADKADGVLEWNKGKLRSKYVQQNSGILAQIYATFDEIAKRSKKAVYYTRKWLITVHPLGGARLSNQSDTGVVNAQGGIYGHEGLYVADAAALPAAPGAPPSMTIAAWSRHVAQGFLCA